MIIVVDTSVVIGVFRGHSSPAVEHLREIEHNGVPFALPAICCQEILQGAKDEREWRQLLEYLEGQERLECFDVWSAHRDAARIFFDCRRRGLTVRSPVDCLIAQQVLDCDGILLHCDQDFERIREVRPLRTLQG